VAILGTPVLSQSSTNHESPQKRDDRLLACMGAHLMALCQEMINTQRTGKVMAEIFFDSGHINGAPQVQYKFSAER